MRIENSHLCKDKIKFDDWKLSQKIIKKVLKVT